MEENNSYHLRSLVLATTGGIILLACLAQILQHPIPFEKRNPSPGFGWSWDFDYDTAMRSPRLAAEDTLDRAAPQPMGVLILSLNKKVPVAGLEIIYRGLSGSGKFKLDVIIPALDPNFAYPHELSEKEARKEFRLVDERFKVSAIGPYTLSLLHLSP